MERTRLRNHSGHPKESHILPVVPELGQAEFMRGVRGEKITPGRTPDIEPVVKGISSISRTAVRRVHQKSPAVARSYFAGKIARFRLMGDRAAATAQTYSDSVERYLEWNGSDGASADVDVSGDVRFGEEHRVRAIAHVVRDDGDDKKIARVVIWDDLALGKDAAEMIALPVLECADQNFGDGTTVAVEVWQLSRGEKHRVEREQALARRTDVEGFFASL